MTHKHELRHRLETLFTAMERLAANPLADNTSFCSELEDLRARLQALEIEIAACEQEVATQESTPPAPLEQIPADEGNSPRRAAALMYEKEWIGFVSSGDEVQPLGDPLETESGIAVPLTASGQQIGQLQIQPALERPWATEETELLTAVAQQASVQIQNLRLLEATERARAEAEAATRRYMHESWDAFLDGIHQDEQVGYAYDRSSVTACLAPVPAEEGIQEEVNVLDEHVGTLYVQPPPAQPLQEEDKQMVAAIASQVAQQIENIRLLADASRARAEAEAATRRLTREGWQAYTSQQESGLGFVYDTRRVKPVGEAEPPQSVSLVQPLTVRGEVIGKLAVANLKEAPPEAQELAASIAERVSVHLETLRLSNEIQQRAAELQTVAHVSTTISTVLDPDELLQSVVDLTKERFGLYHAHIYLADDQGQILFLTAGAGEIGHQMVAEGWSIPLDHQNSIIAEAARSRHFVIANDIYHDRASAYLSNRLLPETRSEMAVPLIVGDKLLGVFDVQSERVGRFSQEDANIYTTLASQVGVALQNARLYVKQAATVAQLRELDRLKSAFLANMSHELRTPLNSILGFSDVILEELDGPITELMDNDLRLIQKNGKHLLHLINDVLDMAKIDAGRMNLHPETFNLHGLFDEVIGITSSLANEKALALRIKENSDQAIDVYADRTRIQQVMINLVNNAIKFTEKGEISIHACRPQNNRHVLISVKDSGLGIPADHLESIFQEFTQVDTSTTRKVGGTGLGLPISRRLIELHGGRLWAESSGIPGEGSVLYVELPLEARISDLAEKQER